MSLPLNFTRLPLCLLFGVINNSKHNHSLMSLEFLTNTIYQQARPRDMADLHAEQC